MFGARSDGIELRVGCLVVCDGRLKALLLGLGQLRSSSCDRKVS